MSNLTAGGFPSVGPTSGGKVYAYNNLSTSPIVVAQANPQRASITFDTPGTVDVIVFPVNVQGLNSAPTTPTNQTLTPTTATLGGGYRIYANGGTRTISGECQGGYQALAISGSGNAFTVTDTNT